MFLGDRTRLTSSSDDQEHSEFVRNEVETVYREGPNGKTSTHIKLNYGRDVFYFTNEVDQFFLVISQMDYKQNTVTLLANVDGEMEEQTLSLRHFVFYHDRFIQYTVTQKMKIGNFGYVILSACPCERESVLKSKYFWRRIICFWFGKTATPLKNTGRVTIAIGNIISL